MLICFIIFVLVLAIIIISNYIIVTSKYQIAISNNALKQSITIVQISDYHNRHFSNRLVELVEKNRPDFIVITGDLVDSFYKINDNTYKLISKLVRLAPILYVNGNHESYGMGYDNLREFLVKNQVIVLENQHYLFSCNGINLNFIGISDPTITGFSVDQYQRLIDSLTVEDSYNILLSHRPEMFEMYKKTRVDLALVGHAHGGQIRFPFLGGLYSPNQGIFPKYTAGVIKDKHFKMVVSRGLGDSYCHFRINNSPELVVIVLQKSCNITNQKS